MTKLLLTTALLAFLAVPAMANGNLANSNWPGGGGTKDVDLGPGYYNSVEELKERLDRLTAQQAAGKQFYGNSKWPIANAIAKTARALAKAQAAGGGPVAPVTAVAPVAPAAEAPTAPEGPPAETPDPETPTQSETPDTPDAPAPSEPDAPAEAPAQ